MMISDLISMDNEYDTRVLQLDVTVTLVLIHFLTLNQLIPL